MALTCMQPPRWPEGPPAPPASARSLLTPVGGSGPRATAEKRSRARGLSRSTAARNPRVMEGACGGQH